MKFYETVLGMQTIPSYNFGFKTKYLRCGDLQLHIFELEDQVPVYQHFAVDVDDFHAAYDAAKAMGALDSTVFRNPVNELPDGCVQMYLRDPAGNLIEIDWPDVETLDRCAHSRDEAVDRVRRTKRGGAGGLPVSRSAASQDPTRAR